MRTTIFWNYTVKEEERREREGEEREKWEEWQMHGL